MNKHVIKNEIDQLIKKKKDMLNYYNEHDKKFEDEDAFK